MIYISRDPTYLKIVNRFEDNRKSPFSIHQIALMGNSEDKKVGEWFGPNTVAQVLKYIHPLPINIIIFLKYKNKKFSFAENS